MKNIFNDIKFICIILFFSIGYSYILNKQLNIADVINILLIIEFLIYIGGFVVVLKINTKPLDYIYTNMAVIVAGMAMFALGYIYLLRIINENEILNFFDKVTQLTIFYTLYEVCCIIWVIKFRNKKINLKKSLIIIFLSAIVTSYISLNWNFNFWMSIGKDSTCNLTCVILKLISTSLKIYALLLLRKTKSEIPRNIYTYISIFIIFKILMQSLSYFKLEYINMNLLMVNCLILAVCNYCILKIMILDILEKQDIMKTSSVNSESVTIDLKKNSSDEISVSNCEHKKSDVNNITIKHEEELKNQLLNNISHEFKTPINVIYSAIQTQELLSKSENKIEYTKYNSIIKQNCNRMIRLINNFIDASRFDKGNVYANFKCVNIVALTKRIIDSVRCYTKYKGVEITFDFSNEKLYALVDVRLFDRLILNLLSNAIKFTENNGNINVYIYSHSDYIEIFIKDDGIGIDKSDLDLIFKKFERLDKSFSRVAEGSGLGLHIVREIINLFNGSIEISGEKGKGTEVKLKLPKHEYKTGEEIFDEKDESFINHDHEVEIEMSDIYL